MALFSFGSKSSPWVTGDFPGPFPASARSILAHLQDLENRGQAAHSVPLPDQEKIDGSSSSGFKLSAGLLDNLTLRREEGSDQITAAILQVLKFPTRANVNRAYQAMVADTALPRVDGVLKGLIEANPDAQRLATFARWLARKAPDREPLKYAIAILGLFKIDQFFPLFMTIGRHEEFAKVISIALLATQPEDRARAALFELAQTLGGWGRIEMVQRLAPMADDKIRHWLVREAFRNGIMNEYLALTAAEHGQLLDQLSAPNAGSDAALIDGAGDILAALSRPDPAGRPPGVGDLYDYSDSAEASLRWLALVSEQPPTPERALTAAYLRTEADAMRLETENWRSLADTIIERAHAYLTSDAATRMVDEALGSDNSSAFYLARDIAKAMDRDIWQYSYDRTAAGHAPALWYDIFTTPDPDRARKAAELYERMVPLSDIATGAAMIAGFESIQDEWRPHMAMEQVARALGAHPGVGVPLLLAALRSPLIVTRSRAAKTLGKWPRDSWPPEVEPALIQAIADEPSDKTRQEMETALSAPAGTTLN